MVPVRRLVVLQMVEKEALSKKIIQSTSMRSLL